MISSPTDPRTRLLALSREEKLDLLARAAAAERLRRREDAAAPPIAPDGSIVVRLPGERGAVLTYRLSADDARL